jgi:hypothetical protein
MKPKILNFSKVGHIVEISYKFCDNCSFMRMLWSIIVPLMSGL